MGVSLRAGALLVLAALSPSSTASAEEPAGGTEIEGKAIGASSGRHGQGRLVLRRRMPDGTQETERVPLGLDGSFRTRPLDRNGLYDLLLTGIHGRMGARRCGLEAGTRGVVLEAVDGLTLSGRLLDDEGAPPPPGTHIQFEAAGAPPEEPGRTGGASTAADGSFAVEDLGPFSFSATIRGGNFEGKPPEDAVFRADASPVEVRAQFAFFLAGRLVAPGDSFEGCTVVVRKAGTDQKLGEFPVGKDGSFQGRRIPRWRVDLVLRVRGEEVPLGSVSLPATAREFQVDVPDPPESRRLDGALARPGTVRFRATTGRDGGLAGASVSLHAWDGKPGVGTPAAAPAATGTTGVDGWYESPVLPAGWYEVRIRAEGHQPSEWNALSGGVYSTTVHQGGFIGGTVVDASSGEAVVGACVTAQRTGPGPERASGTVVSGAGGAFEIRLPTAGVYDVSVHGGGSRMEGPKPIPGDHLPTRIEGIRDGNRELRIALRPGGAVGGVIRDGEGNPFPPEELAKVHLMLQDKGPDADEDAICPNMAPKSPGGEFRFGSLRHGPYVIFVSLQSEGAPGLRFGPFAAETGRTDLEIRLPIGGTISGRVLDEYGTPFEHPSTVQLFRAGDPTGRGTYAKIAADGTFHSGRLDPTCSYDVLATRPGRPPAVAEGIRPGLADLVLVQKRGSSIRGVAVDETGEPLPPGTGLYARPAKRQDRFRHLDSARGDTGAGGSFVLDGLVPDTAYFIDVASRDRFLPSAGDPAVAAGATDLVLLFRRGCVLAGRIVDGSGKPLGPWLDIRAEPAEPGGVPGWTTFAAVTDDQGRFRLPCVPPGRLRIRASKGANSWDLGEVTAPADDLTLTPR